MSLFMVHENQGWKMLDCNIYARFQLAITNNQGNINTRRILNISGRNDQSTALKIIRI
jgi:hypothetical protein